MAEATAHTKIANFKRFIDGLVMNEVYVGNGGDIVNSKEADETTKAEMKVKTKSKVLPSHSGTSAMGVFTNLTYTPLTGLMQCTFLF